MHSWAAVLGCVSVRRIVCFARAGSGAGWALHANDRREMLSSEDRQAVDTIEEASTAVLTLAEGLEQTELLGSRLTKLEIRRQLLSAVDAHAALSARAREAMEELDFSGWASVGQRIREGGESEINASWMAIQAMAPATLGWIRFYKSQKPELFTPPDEE